MRLLKILCLLQLSSSLHLRNIWKKYRLNQETSKRQINPSQLTDENKDRLSKIGFVYDEATKKWKRQSSDNKPDYRYGRSPDIDPHTEQLWISSAQSEFDDEPFLFETKSRIRFTPRPIDIQKSKELSMNEQTQRLGFVFANGKWSRGTPRNTPRTISIKSNNRILYISVVDDDDIKVINRLDYIISRSLYETPMNVWDGALRIGRDKATFFIWTIAQYKLWTLFTDHHIVLDDAWSSVIDSNIPEITTSIWLTGLFFFASKYVTNTIWDESSGSLVSGALERSITDGIISNYTNSPASYTDRKAMGSKHTLLASLLRVISVFPRVAIVQGYLQDKLYYNLLGMSSLGSIMNHNQLHYQLIFETSIIMGLLSVLAEISTFRWIRPPRTSFDEIKAIRESILMDDIYIRMLQKRRNDMIKMKNGKTMIRVLDTQISRAIKEQTLFKNLTNTWLYNFHFHNTNIQSVMEKNNTDKIFVTPLLLSNFISGTSVALAYGLSHSLTIPIAMNVIGSYIEESPVLHLKKADAYNHTIA